MPAKKRRSEPAVIERLFREPYRFEYFHAVHLLERWLVRHGMGREGHPADVVRFQNPTSLAFPASQLAAIRTEPPGLAADVAALADAVKTCTLQYVRVTPAFMGLLGGNGVLPAHYTERIARHQQHEGDEGPRAFLDTFSSRSLALFYQAWRKYRLALTVQPGTRDGFLPLLLSLAGLGHPSLQQRYARADRGTLRDEALGSFAAALRHRPASAAQLARVLSAYFGLPIAAEQFIGQWYGVPRGHRTTLGSQTAVLGASAIAGVRVWQRDLRLRLVAGPLGRERFDAFLPGGAAARALASLVSLVTGVALEYEVELVLLGTAVRGTVLADERAGRLGWDAYLVTGEQAHDRNDVRYRLDQA